MNPDASLDDNPVEYTTRLVYCIKLYTGPSTARSKAIMFRGLTWDEANLHYERINEALGHRRDYEGELLVYGDSGIPYVLIAYDD